MKAIALAAIIFPALCLAGGNVALLNWQASAGNLRDITFPITMNRADHETGYYFSMQFGFEGVNNHGYTGMQPREDVNGKSVVHGAFSVFGDGTTSNHPNCNTGADGGSGTTCRVEINGSYTPTWNFVVENIGGTTWRGTMVDTSTGVGTVIGEYTLPSGASGIKNYYNGFVEYYLWNGLQQPICSALPKTSVTFGIPTTKTNNFKITLGNAWEDDEGYGNDITQCAGQVNFSRVRTADGEVVDCGFSNSTYWYAMMDHTSPARGWAPDLDGDYNYPVFMAVKPGDGAGIQKVINAGSSGDRHGQWLASQPRVGV